MRIGLTLSGGGFRAAAFHFGVLARLAEGNLLEKVTFLSTVSGGSLCAGLTYANSEFVWPASAHFIEAVLPKARQILTTLDLQMELAWRALRSPLSIFQSRANYLSSLLQQRWGITAQLCDLPPHPRWLINATTYETGKNWRFESFQMGDYVFGYTCDTRTPLSDALAASAGFPGLIGALEFKTGDHRWFNYIDGAPEGNALLDPSTYRARKTKPVEPAFEVVHLWDGGVYDNFGLEGLFHVDQGWRENVDFLIVSDASGKPRSEKYQPGVHALLRIVTGIMMDQVRSLRARSVLERMTQHQDQGAYLEMGNTCEEVLSAAGRQVDAARLGAQCLDKETARWATDYPTMIGRLPERDFDQLCRHGYEVADYTLHAYHVDEYPFVGYANSRCHSLTSSTCE